jgi:hypothetical protein
VVAVLVVGVTEVVDDGVPLLDQLESSVLQVRVFSLPARVLLDYLGDLGAFQVLGLDVQSL